MVVLGHSAGGRTAFNLAFDYPDNVISVIGVEPVLCPTDSTTLQNQFIDQQRSLLTLWGDNLDRGSPSIQTRYQSCKTAEALIQANGGHANAIFLPDEGVYGNTHLLMQDTNSKDLSSLIVDWLKIAN